MTIMNYLCDTNIVSELWRPKPNPDVVMWVSEQTTISISVITIEEIRYGLTWRPKPKIQTWFDEFIKTDCELLSITDEIADCAGRIRGRLAAQGLVHAQPDMLIAATAYVHKRILVTRNIRDFQGCGIELLNPFQ